MAEKGVKYKKNVKVLLNLFLQVTEEMLAVLTEGDGRGGRVQEASSSLSQLSTQNQEATSSLSQLSTQTVFSMLAHLTQWSRHTLSARIKHSG